MDGASEEYGNAGGTNTTPRSQTPRSNPRKVGKNVRVMETFKPKSGSGTAFGSGRCRTTASSIRRDHRLSAGLTVRANAPSLSLKSLLNRARDSP